MTIAVVGATGNTGLAVVKELRALGQNPVCVVRNGEKAREALGRDAKTAVAELSDRPALEKALAGIQSVFVITGHNPGMAEQESNVLDAALKVGARYLVRVSGARAAGKAGSDSVVVSGHAAINERLKASGLGWVILSPSMFMQNMLSQAASIKTDSKIALPFAKDLPVTPIDARDTGAVGARILIDPAPHAGKTYEITGKLTTYGAFAEVFSQVLGRPIAYVAITPEQAGQGMKARGMPDRLVAHNVALAKIGAAGGFSTEHTKVVEDLVGRAPITARQFVEDSKGLFS
ncbi:MAG: NmrA family NAD(P)-binding protein [Alphaproteobacteria bacterium]|nr:NmrA family NAD(P)-binding protein [Alphaproteobacteria bacterium]